MSIIINKIRTTVIVHANCTDGSLAAYLYWHYVKTHAWYNLRGIEFVFHQADMSLPQVNGDAVICVDVALTQEQLGSDVLKHKLIKSLDNLSLSIGSTRGSWKYKCLCCGTDSTRNPAIDRHQSASGLMYEFLYANSADRRAIVPDVVMGRMSYLVRGVSGIGVSGAPRPETNKILEMLRSLPPTFQDWDSFIGDPGNPAFEEWTSGKRILSNPPGDTPVDYAAGARIIDYGLTRRSRSSRSKIAVVSCPVEFDKQVGDDLLKNNALAVMYTISPKSGEITAYICGDDTARDDVAKIAAYFGVEVNSEGAAEIWVDHSGQPALFTDFLSGLIWTKILDWVDTTNQPIERETQMPTTETDKQTTDIVPEQHRKMALGELLSALLEQLNSGKNGRIVEHGFGQGSNYREGYEEISFVPKSNVTIMEMFNSAAYMLGLTVGGGNTEKFIVTPDTPVNITFWRDGIAGGDGITPSRLSAILENYHQSDIRPHNQD